jgi:hypothetical protein
MTLEKPKIPKTTDTIETVSIHFVAVSIFLSGLRSNMQVSLLDVDYRSCRLLSRAERIQVI